MSNKTTGYTLYYHGAHSGRGEFVRLAFEYAGVPYKDPKQPRAYMNNVEKTSNPPHFAPPILELPNGSFISQTANILNYLAPKLGLDGVPESMTDEADIAVRRAHVNQLVMLCMDVTHEAHDTHHPIAVMKYYEEQKEESLRKSEDFRETRIPKFLKFFSLALKSNPENEGASEKHLVGSTMTTADLATYHALCGVEYAFPRRMATMRKDVDFAELFEFVDAIGKTENIASYLQSERRMPWALGIFRQYPELDAA